MFRRFWKLAQSLLAHGAKGLIICSRGKSCIDAVSNLKKDFSLQSDVCIVGFQCDVSSKEGRRQLVQKIKDVFDNQLDGLINNVGLNVRRSVEEQTESEYKQIMQTNIDSAYFLCKDLKEMLVNAAMNNGNAAIVNVSSAAGVQSSGTGAVYGMSKAAMIQFSKVLACEWAKYNIRVNAVAPWMTMTPMLNESIKSNPQQLDKVKAWTPMNRLATPEEVAGPITFLLMGSSSYITGQCLGIDGGLTAQGFDGPCVTLEVKNNH